MMKCVIVAFDKPKPATCADEIEIKPHEIRCVVDHDLRWQTFMRWLEKLGMHVNANDLRRDNEGIVYSIYEISIAYGMMLTMEE